jgi:3-oxoacyl-[acyl-carrier-protein] synthase-3
MQKNYGIKFLSFASALPSHCVKNTDLEKLYETSDEWIYTRTGIKERRIISANESGLTLCVSAANEVIKKSKVNPEDIDLIIVATTTPDKLYPTMSCMLQGKIGAKNAVCFDLSAACTGFVYSIVTGAQFIYSGQFKNVLVVGVDVHSRFLDWSERSVSILFGDGAGAVLMTGCLAGEDQLLGYSVHSASDVNFDLELDNSNITFSDYNKPKCSNFVKMNGKAIYQFALKVVPDVINKLLDKINLNVSQIDYLVLHQANQRIIDSVSEKMNFHKSKVISNIERVGNTSAASIPIAISEALNENKIKRPCKLLLVGFGAGLTWGAVVIHLK